VNGRQTPSEPQPGLALFAAVFFASPLILLAWAAGCALQRATGWPRWRLFLAASVAGLAVVWVQGGPANALASHFSGLLSLAHQFGRPMLHLPGPGAFLIPQIALSVPAGLLAASLTRGRDLAVPDPAAQVREQRRQVKVERKARVIAAKTSEARTFEPKPDARALVPLGVSLGGDLPPSWRAGRFVVLPDHAARLPRLVIGQSGAGKSTYLARETFLAALDVRQVIALDGKGDPQYVQAITDAYLAGNPGASIHHFPAEPVNGWQGDPAAQVNRLLGCWAWSIEAQYYKEICTLALRLACGIPGPPVDSMAELVRRLDPPTLARSWAKNPAEAALVKMITPKLSDVCMRLANLAAATGGLLDGQRPVGNADLCVISIPMMANQGDGEALFRILMADVAHWVSTRKGSRPATLMIDEFSAISGGRDHAIHVLERGRSAGVPAILSGQSYASLGSAEDADRIVSAANTIALFASNTPDDLARLAGSVQTAEAVLQAEDGRFTGRASVTTRARHRVDPNVVRQLQPGQAVLVSGGRAERLQVIRAPGANNDLALPRRPFAVISRGARSAVTASTTAPANSGPAASEVDPPPSSSGSGTPSPRVGHQQPPDDRANPKEGTP
jgi:hypothetical protein